MGTKNTKYNRMYEILEKIQASIDGEEMRNLIIEYHDHNIESRKEVDFDKKNHPDNKLEQRHKSIELRIKNIEIKQKMMRESIDSGNGEYTEDDLDEVNNNWSEWVRRSNCIDSLIVMRIQLNDEWSELQENLKDIR